MFIMLKIVESTYHSKTGSGIKHLSAAGAVIMGVSQGKMLVRKMSAAQDRKLEERKRLTLRSLSGFKNLW